MTQKKEPTDTTAVEELVVSNTIQLDALRQVLIAKGLMTADEFQTALQLVQDAYRRQTDDRP